MLRTAVRLLLIALVAALLAGAVGVVSYVLLLPSFIERTANGIVEPRWLPPATIGGSLLLSGFLAQRVLAAGSEREGQLAASAVLGVSIGVLLELTWSARLLLTGASLTTLIQAWSPTPLVPALVGAVLGHTLSHLRAAAAKRRTARRKIAK
jgi:hypothetical protein